METDHCFPKPLPETLQGGTSGSPCGLRPRWEREREICGSKRIGLGPPWPPHQLVLTGDQCRDCPSCDTCGSLPLPSELFTTLCCSPGDLRISTGAAAAQLLLKPASWDLLFQEPVSLFNILLFRDMFVCQPRDNLLTEQVVESGMQPGQLQLPFPTKTAWNKRGLLLPQGGDGLRAVLICIEDLGAIPVVPARGTVFPSSLGVHQAHPTGRRCGGCHSSSSPGAVSGWVGASLTSGWGVMPGVSSPLCRAAAPGEGFGGCLFIYLYAPPGSSHVSHVTSANVSCCWELIYFHFSEDLGHGFVSGF